MVVREGVLPWNVLWHSPSDKFGNSGENKVKEFSHSLFLSLIDVLCVSLTRGKAAFQTLSDHSHLDDAAS
jgi:hypothetical protein